MEDGDVEVEVDRDLRSRSLSLGGLVPGGAVEYAYPYADGGDIELGLLLSLGGLVAVLVLSRVGEREEPDLYRAEKAAACEKSRGRSSSS